MSVSSSVMAGWCKTTQVWSKTMCIIFSLVSLVVKEVSCNVEPSYFMNNLCRIVDMMD